MTRILFPALIAAATLTVVTSGTPADASVRWGKCGAATRVHGKGTQCANGFTYNFLVGSPTENWTAKLTTPMNQCAPLKFSLELDGKPLKTTAALGPGKSETVVLGSGLAAGTHALIVKTQFMYSECFPEDPPATPGNWGVDAFISAQPK